MSGHYVTRLNTRTRCEPWTDEQIELLVLNWREMSDKGLAVYLSCNGPPRTESAIVDKRCAMGLKRPSGYAKHSELGRAIAVGQYMGWPVVLGPAEHLRRLFDGLNAERAKMQGRGV